MILKSLSKTIICVLLIYVQGLNAQIQDTMASEKAKRLYDASNYKETILFCNNSLAELLPEKDLDSLEVSKLYIYLTGSYYRTRENEKSIEAGNKGLSYCLNSQEGNNVKAKILYWKSFPEYFLNKPYVSYDSKKEALNILKTVKDPDLEFLTGVYAELSLDMAFMGYLEKAYYYIEKALETNLIKNNEALQKDTYSIEEDLELWLKYRYAQVVNKKLDLEFNYEGQKKIKNVITAYTNFKEQHPNYWPIEHKIKLGAIYGYYGNTFIADSNQEKEADSALFYYSKAKQEFNISDHKYHHNLIRYNIARAYNVKGNYIEALKTINELIADENNPNSSTYSSLKASLMLKLKQYENWEKLVFETLENIHDSSEPLRSDFSNFLPSSSINQISDILQLAASVELDSKDSLFINTKKQLYNLAVQQFKKSYRFSSFNFRLKNYFNEAFDGVLQMTSKNLSKGEIRQLVNDIENIENRLAWKQFSKSRRLVNLPFIDSLEKVEYQLRNKLVTAKRENSSKRVDSIEDALKYNELYVEKNYPKFSVLKTNSFDVSSFQKKIPEEEVLLKYLFFKNTFVVFEITKESIELYLKPWGTKEKKLLNNYINQIKNSNLGFELSKNLTTKLIPQSALSYDKIIIIGDNPIYQLPFETLAYNNEFLVKNKSIRYSSHLRLLYVEDEVNNIKENTPLVSLFAPAYPKRDLTIATRSVPYYLEGAQKEAEEIKKIFETNAFIGEDATKEEFINHKSDGTILHLAMHATMDEVNPNFSHFNFPKKEKLHLEELYALNIPVSLAVLGACNTAVGAEDSALNINSLHRAFSFAGAEATIASLWEVPDMSTKTIMVDFYKNLKKGKTKSEALQQAKINYLRETDNPKLRHPYYWAGFVLYGDDAPVTHPSKSYLIFIFGGIAFAGLAYQYYQRKKKKTA